MQDLVKSLYLLCRSRLNLNLSIGAGYCTCTNEEQSNKAGQFHLSFLPHVRTLLLQSYFISAVGYGVQKVCKVIYNMALLEALYDGPSTKRLVIMLPGKVLYEKDYFPGKVYMDFISDNARARDRYVEIFPIKMQNLFNLVDVVPGIDWL